MAGAGWDFLAPVEVYTNQARMTTLGLITNRAFLSDQTEAFTFEQLDEFAKPHNRDVISEARYPKACYRRNSSAS